MDWKPTADRVDGFEGPHWECEHYVATPRPFEQSGRLSFRWHTFRRLADGSTKELNSSPWQQPSDVDSLDPEASDIQPDFVAARAGIERMIRDTRDDV